MFDFEEIEKLSREFHTDKPQRRNSMRTYKVIVYREVQQSATVEVETDSTDINEIKQIAEDATLELSDHDWKDEETQIMSEDTHVKRHKVR